LFYRRFRSGKESGKEWQKEVMSRWTDRFFRGCGKTRSIAGTDQKGKKLYEGKASFWGEERKSGESSVKTSCS